MKIISQVISLFNWPFWVNVIALICVQVWNVLKQRSLAKQDAKLTEMTNELQEKLNEKQHVSQQRFDLELKIYISLSEKLNNAVDDCVALMPVVDVVYKDKNTEIKRRATNFVSSNNIFVKEKRAYAPFYDKEVSEKLQDILALMSEQYRYFGYLHFDSNMKSWIEKRLGTVYENNGRLSDLQTEVTNLISKRLDNFSK